MSSSCSIIYTSEAIPPLSILLTWILQVQLSERLAALCLPRKDITVFHCHNLYTIGTKILTLSLREVRSTSKQSRIMNAELY